MRPKLLKQVVLARIESTEKAIVICREYLQTGANADWRGFRPLFKAKMKDGKELPPHPDWVRHWVLPRFEKALNRAEKQLEQLERVSNRNSD